VLRLDTNERAPAVLGDADRLQQVVWNLLSNAIKFTPHGGEVWVGLARHAGHAEISVRDTGQGIAPEFLPHVFDRFRQADGTPTRAHGGLGLGLAIVRHLVELHGGTVEAASAGEGRGATFTVHLPTTELRYADFDLRINEQADGQSAISNPQSAILQGLRVLVVDDEADTRELLQHALTQAGAHVTHAATAAQALLILEDERPDLLISDIGMPGTDGYALMRAVRAREAARGLTHLPAIALTAYARADDRAQALATGYDTHIAKPVEPSELIAELARLAKIGTREE
jgi:CheY-like chemotaxis protein